MSQRKMANLPEEILEAVVTEHGRIKNVRCSDCVVSRGEKGAAHR